MTRRLIRESDPPAGQLASPVPQYWNPNTEAFEDVLGAHGAPRAILYGTNGQPISQSNPLEVRVRELEAELAAMRGMLETGDAKVQLKGRIVEEVLLPRGVRTTSERIRVDIPTGARYAVINGYVYGRTGTFADGEGFRVTALIQGFYSLHVHHGVGAQTKYSYTSQQIHLLGLGPEVSRPSSDVVMNPSERWAQYVAEAVPLVGRLYVERGISGTFGEGEGIDSEVRITWYM